MPIGQIDKRDHFLVLNPVEGFNYTTYGPWKSRSKRQIQQETQRSRRRKEYISLILAKHDIYYALLTAKRTQKKEGYAEGNG